MIPRDEFPNPELDQATLEQIADEIELRGAENEIRTILQERHMKRRKEWLKQMEKKGYPK